MDGETLIEVKIVNNDGVDPTGVQVPMVITLNDLRDQLLTLMDGTTEPTWAV